VKLHEIIARGCPYPWWHNTHDAYDAEAEDTYPVFEDCRCVVAVVEAEPKEELAYNVRRCLKSSYT
jgi:hypothetical protein